MLIVIPHRSSTPVKSVPVNWQPSVRGGLISMNIVFTLLPLIGRHDRDEERTVTTRVGELVKADRVDPL
jgi:hypothetical protein